MNTPFFFFGTIATIRFCKFSLLQCAKKIWNTSKFSITVKVCRKIPFEFTTERVRENYKIKLMGRYWAYALRNFFKSYYSLILLFHWYTGSIWPGTFFFFHREKALASFESISKLAWHWKMNSGSKWPSVLQSLKKLCKIAIASLNYVASYARTFYRYEKKLFHNRTNEFIMNWRREKKVRDGDDERARKMRARICFGIVWRCIMKMPRWRRESRTWEMRGDDIRG